MPFLAVWEMEFESSGWQSRRGPSPSTCRSHPDRPPMRLLIDSLVALMLAGVLAGIIIANRENGDQEEKFDRGYLDLRGSGRYNSRRRSKRSPSHHRVGRSPSTPSGLTDHFLTTPSWMM